jgi:hypothetical protein
VIVERELGCAVVELEERAPVGVRPAENVPGDVGALQVLRPGSRECVEPPVEGLKLGSLCRRHVVLGDDDEVHVAVGVGIADGERSLEIRAAETVAESFPYPGHELGQHLVQVAEGRRAQAATSASRASNSEP